MHYPASSPRLSLDSPMMVVEDVDDPISYEQHQMTGIVPNKAIVKGFPPNTEDYVLELYLGHLAQGSHCCDIQVYGHVAVATFQSPIGTFNFCTICSVHFKVCILSPYLRCHQNASTIQELSFSKPQEAP